MTKGYRIGNSVSSFHTPLILNRFSGFCGDLPSPLCSHSIDLSLLNQTQIQNYQFCKCISSSKLKSNKAFKALSLALLVMMGGADIANAKTTTADFLKWERKAQDNFFQVSFSMAGFIAADIQPKVARCLNEWYYASADLQKKRHDEIIEVMPQYKNLEPTAVVLGVVHEICGTFKSN